MGKIPGIAHLRAVKALGWDPQSVVNIITQAPEVAGSALQAGKIDAHADFVPFATIFTFSARESALHATSEMLADHLLRHGVVAQISDWTDTGEMSALEALFASLDTQNADLIVAGAFGHSRLFENLFGGVSNDMMRQPTAPIFVAH